MAIYQTLKQFMIIGRYLMRLTRIIPVRFRIKKKSGLPQRGCDATLNYRGKKSETGSQLRLKN